MQYFLIALGSIILFIAILMLLTGGTVQNLVDFFVEKLDDNNTPVHPVKLLQDHPIKLFQKDPAMKTKETPAPQEAVPDKPVQEATGERVQEAPAEPVQEVPETVEVPEKPEIPEPTVPLEPPLPLDPPETAELPEEPEAPAASQSAAPDLKKPRSNKNSSRHPAPRSTKQGTKRNPNQVYTEIATLTHKIDERRRVVDSSGHSTLYDEYFELVFETRRGETLRMVATRATFKEIPFNQEGALTYKRNRILKFRYNGGTVVDELSSSLS